MALAAQRSALSLAEEYEAMEGEIAAELPRLELELAEAADRCLSTTNGVIREAASQAYGQLLECSIAVTATRMAASTKHPASNFWASNSEQASLRTGRGNPACLFLAGLFVRSI